MRFFEERRLRKQAKTLVTHAVHLISLRGDLLGAEDVGRIRSLVLALNAALKARDGRGIREQSAVLSTYLEAQMARHPQRGGAFRENFEIIVVAVAAAMGLRAYFIQPFKIPTGSMQPTLYGITSDAGYQPGPMDRLPLKIVKFVFTGDWYSERRAAADGRLGEGIPSATDPSAVNFIIGGRRHTVPKDALHDGRGHGNPLFHPNRQVQKGDVIWRGVTRRGDHLFVNKVIWNFRRPRRDEVMVFTTDTIVSLEPGTHYIKRMCGMPGERISIHPPNLVINGEPVAGLRGISRVASEGDGYDGYQLAGLLNAETLEWPMRADEYFALGDNTGNSRDSRYWGPVPARNLVGPAVFVYWPFSRRWGLIR